MTSPLPAGIPHFFDYFHNYNGKAVLVIELLGKSLDSLLKSKKTFSIKTSMMIGLRIVCVFHPKSLATNTFHDYLMTIFLAGHHRSNSRERPYIQ